MQKMEQIGLLCIENPILNKKIVPDTEYVIETKDIFLQDMHRIIIGNKHSENKKKTSLLGNKFRRK